MQIQNCRWNLCENHFRWENQFIGLLFFSCAPFSSQLLIFVQNWTPVLGTLRIIRWAVGWQVIERWNCELRAAPLRLSMWPCERKLNKEKSKHAPLSQQNGFGPAFLHIMLRLVKKEQHNATPAFDWVLVWGWWKAQQSLLTAVDWVLVWGWWNDTAKLTDCCWLGIGLIAEAGKRHSKA